jgi:hypothetical protein
MIDQVVFLLSLYYGTAWNPTAPGDHKPTKQTKTSLARNVTTALVTILTEFKKTGKIPSDCVLRKSLFDDARGERFEYAMLCLSNLVLSTVLCREHGAVVACFDPKCGKEVYEGELVTLADEIVQCMCIFY